MTNKILFEYSPTDREALWSREEWNSYRQLIIKDWENKEEIVQKMHLAVLVAYAPEACSE
jgi:hypothetical protein